VADHNGGEAGDDVFLPYRIAASVLDNSSETA
jgi:hypothetical protein